MTFNLLAFVENASSHLVILSFKLLYYLETRALWFLQSNAHRHKDEALQDLSSQIFFICFSNNPWGSFRLNQNTSVVFFFLTFFGFLLFILNFFMCYFFFSRLATRPIHINFEMIYSHHFSYFSEGIASLRFDI